MLSSRSQFDPVTAEEWAERHRIEGPWQRTQYELFDWVTPLTILTKGNVQDETVDRAQLSPLPLSACLGTARSDASGEWPRDPFDVGASVAFTFSTAPTSEGGAIGPASVPPLAVTEIPYQDAGVGHTVWHAAVVLSIFMRSPAGIELLSQSARTPGRLPRLLELGAGLGLPGRDASARGNVASLVTISDTRPALLAQLSLDLVIDAAAADAAAQSLEPSIWSSIQPRAEPLAEPLAESRAAANIEVMRLNWNDAAGE